MVDEATYIRLGPVHGAEVKHPLEKILDRCGETVERSSRQDAEATSCHRRSARKQGQPNVLGNDEQLSG